MRQVKIKLFPLTELSEQAQKRAYSEWMEMTRSDYPYAEENRKTLEAFEQVFPIKVTHWEYDTVSGSVRFDFTDDSLAGISGLRLYAKLMHNYFEHITKGKYYSKLTSIEPIRYVCRHSQTLIERQSCALTGYSVDEDILDPIWKFLAHPDESTTFESLMRECVDRWVKACVVDAEYCVSFEYFMEEAQAAEYEFFENGAFFHHKEAA